MNQNQPIREIIIRAQQGDQQAFAGLMESYRQVIFRYIHSMLNNHEDAEDVFQETFYKAFRSINKFMIDYSFYKWILKIAYNTCIDFLRKKKLPTVPIKTQSRFDDKEIELDLIDPCSDPDTVLKQKETAHKLEEEIRHLPKTYQEIIIYRFFDQLSYEEIAVKMNIPEGTVKTRLFRAREILKEKFSGWY
ncbi:MAG: RNA polymerase sigma factor [Candidatus Delongbacteria bacterium]|nr:RNA polymerase sigma factor [Candidatus Delongbacteria bacterium]